jgi:signal transduction histidine kinase
MQLPDSGLEALEQRYESLFRLLPYLLLAVPFVPYVLSQTPDAGAFGITAAIAAGAVAWMAWLVTLHPSWARYRWLMWVYVAGLVAFIYALTIRSPWFVFYSWSGFIAAFRYVTGIWRWLTSLAVGVAFATSVSGGFHRPTVASVAIWLVLALVYMGLVGASVLLGQRSEEQNQARKAMIAELTAANQRLTELQAQLVSQATQAGIMQERQRLAREIHDTLAQGLTGIVTQLEAAQQTPNSAERTRRIDNAKQLARDSLAEARRSVQALRPQVLEHARLPEALAEETARWSATSGVAADVTTTGDPLPLHPEIEVTLLRVAQEALANVAKHAIATHAGVTLSYMGDVVTLDVRDDGKGFSVTGAAPGEGGFGLTAMRQRVTRLAGQLEIESEPGGGTAVSASVPAIPIGPVVQ